MQVNDRKKRQKEETEEHVGSYIPYGRAHKEKFASRTIYQFSSIPTVLTRKLWIRADNVESGTGYSSDEQ